MLYNDTWVFSGRLVSEFRVQLNKFLYGVEPQDKYGPEIDINGYGDFGRLSYLPTHYQEWQGQVQENLFLTAGRHSIRFGASANPIKDNTAVASYIGGQIEFAQVVPIGALLNSVSQNPNTAAQIAAIWAAAGQPGLVANLNDPITALQAFNLGIPVF